MSLQINEREITGVLLADGWHKCVDLGTDAYEFGSYYPDDDYGSGWGFDLHHGGGRSGCAPPALSSRTQARAR